MNITSRVRHQDIGFYFENLPSKTDILREWPIPRQELSNYRGSAQFLLIEDLT
jgi:hypothetical protein